MQSSDSGGRAIHARSAAFDDLANPRSLRTIFNDSLLQSAAGKYSLYFEAGWSAVQNLLPIIERELAPSHARPHWGKLFTISPAIFRAKNEKLSDLSTCESDTTQKGN